ncbi:KRAB-A domain-containing protein 2, partial [Stegodyphus mimosarum]
MLRQSMKSDILYLQNAKCKPAKYEIHLRFISNNQKLYTRSSYMMQKKTKMTTKKGSRNYWLLSRCDVMFVKFIYPVKEDVSIIQYYITDIELFHILHETHLAIEYRGRDRILKDFSNKCKNFTHDDIEQRVLSIHPCTKKQNGTKNGIIVKPILFSELNSNNTSPPLSRRNMI